MGSEALRWLLTPHGCRHLARVVCAQPADCGPPGSWSGKEKASRRRPLHQPSTRVRPQAIEDCLRDVAEERGSTSITPALLHDALLRAHPDTPQPTLHEFCRRAFGSKWERKGKASSSLAQVRGGRRCVGTHVACGPSAASPTSTLLGCQQRLPCPHPQPAAGRAAAR